MPQHSLILISLLCLGLAHGQSDNEPKPEHDPVLKAMLEDEESTTEPDEENEPDEPTDESEQDEEETDQSESTTTEDEPVLVTGKPPGELPEDHPEDTLEQPESPITPPTGVEVDVAPGKTRANITADQIKVIAPFPAKLLASPPNGWKVTHPDHTPEKTESITLSNQQTIELTIRPHLLVPDADGAKIFALNEPGFDPALSYDQRETIGSILADSIHQLDKQDARLSAAANRLSELLDSLPPVDTVESDQTPPPSEP